MDEGLERDATLAARQLAHDLLQSLAIIRATVATHRMGSPDSTLEPILGIVEREVDVMAGLCEEEVHGTRMADPIDPGDIAAVVVDRMRIAYAGELQLDLDGVHTLPAMRGSASEWERSLLNLVENGCRAAGPEGKVVVRCSSDTESLTLSVADSGPGFGESPAGRSSLGMAVVMRLVEHHNGHLELRRSDLGGAQLSVVLPLRPTP